MILLDIGTTDYSKCWEFQKRIVEAKIRGRLPDLVLYTEHRSVITLGARTDKARVIHDQEVLSQAAINVVSTDRGGQATYHGPGQLVAYPIVDLRGRNLSARTYVNLLELILLDSLAKLGIQAVSLSGKPGIWIDESRKLASIGVKINKRIAHHGFSLNVALDFDPCRFMVACGMPGIRMVSINRLNKSIDMHITKRVLADSFSIFFGEQLVSMDVYQFNCKLAQAK
jgi:lipoate-protein ligase B